MYLIATLMSLADEIMPSTSKEVIDVYGDESEHLAEMNRQGCLKCENCEHFQDKIDKIITMLHEIQADSNQRQDRSKQTRERIRYKDRHVNR